MKKNSLFAILATFLMVFSSCSSSDEVLTPEDQSSKMLKSYKIKRDASGAYSLDLKVENNVSVGQLQDEIANTNEFYMSFSENQLKQKNTFEAELLNEGENFKVDFINENNANKPSVTIFDSATKFAHKTGADDAFLKQYSVSKDENGKYIVDFEVRSDIKVDFVYNEETKSHEIHLEEGTASELTFSRAIENTEDGVLTISFVNHIDNENAKALRTEIKPRIIIDEGEEVEI